MGERNYDAFFTHGGFFNPSFDTSVDPLLQIEKRGPVYLRVNNEWLASVKLTNASKSAIAAPLFLEVRVLNKVQNEDDGVAVSSGSNAVKKLGLSGAGEFTRFLIRIEAGFDGLLNPGESVLVPLSFRSFPPLKPRFTVHVLQGQNSDWDDDHASVVAGNEHGFVVRRPGGRREPLSAITAIPSWSASRREKPGRPRLARKDPLGPGRARAWVASARSSSRLNKELIGLGPGNDTLTEQDGKRIMARYGEVRRHHRPGRSPTG